MSMCEWIHHIMEHHSVIKGTLTWMKLKGITLSESNLSHGFHLYDIVKNAKL